MVMEQYEKVRERASGLGTVRGDGHGWLWFDA